MSDTVDCVKGDKISLQAENSSGKQTLWIDKFTDDTYKFTLTGVHNGKDIQIDFKELESNEFRILIKNLYELTKE